MTKGCLREKASVNLNLNLSINKTGKTSEIPWMCSPWDYIFKHWHSFRPQDSPRLMERDEKRVKIMLLTQPQTNMYSKRLGKGWIPELVWESKVV